MRLFTALDPPESLRTDLAGVQESSALSARWTDPEQFHVTLRFIGDVSNEQAVRYEEVLADVNVRPVHCAPYGLDVLPSRRSPRVFVLGLERTDSIMALHEAVSEALEAEGLDPEDRTYYPHVTIGRLDDPDPSVVHNDLEAQEERSFSSFTANRFVLYESTLTSEGAVHEPQALYPLAD